MTFPITFGQVAGLLAVGVTILALAAFGVRDFLRDGRWWLVLLAGAVIVFGLVYDASLGRAHDQYHDWKIPGTTTSCCNDRDCRPTSAWQDINGGWWVRTNGQDIAIPERVILPKQPDGRCHICEANGTVFCFAPCDVRS